MDSKRVDLSIKVRPIRTPWGERLWWVMAVMAVMAAVEVVVIVAVVG